MRKLGELLRRIFEPGEGGLSAGGALLFACGLAAYAAVVCSPPAFEPRYSLYLDSVSFYWIQALWDKGLYAGDRLAQFYAASLSPLHYESLWIWLTALFMKVSPYTMGLKALAVLACGASALMVRRLALASPAPRAAGAAALLFAATFLSMDTFFGVPRVYGALAFFGFAWAAEARRFLLLPALVALCVVVYPSAAVGLAFTAALVPFFFREEFTGAVLKKYLLASFAWAALCLLLLSQGGLMNYVRPGAGSSESFQSSKLYQGVSSHVDPGNLADAVLNFAFNLNEHGRLYMIFMVLLALVWGLGKLAAPGQPVKLPRAVTALLAGCGIAFLLLYFHHPVSASRQLVLIVPLALVFLAAGGLLALSEGRFRSGAAAAVCGAVFAGLYPFFGEMDSVRRYTGAYRLIAALPQGAVLAGYPESDLLVTAPVFTGKAVLLSAETADQEILFLSGPEDYAARRRALLEALYCARPGAAAALLPGGAEWLLFERKYYEPEFLNRAAASGSPLHKEVAALLRSGQDPAACYRAARAAAAFSWSGESEGFAVYLGGAAGAVK